MSSPGHAGGAARAALQQVVEPGRGLLQLCPWRGKGPEGLKLWEQLPQSSPLPVQELGKPQEEIAP